MNLRNRWKIFIHQASLFERKVYLLINGFIYLLSPQIIRRMEHQ